MAPKSGVHNTRPRFQEPSDRQGWWKTTLHEASWKRESKRTRTWCSNAAIRVAGVSATLQHKHTCECTLCGIIEAGVNSFKWGQLFAIDLHKNMASACRMHNINSAILTQTITVRLND
eukprot:2906796-Amphidinium_carterae.1